LIQQPQSQQKTMASPYHAPKGETYQQASEVFELQKMHSLLIAYQDENEELLVDAQELLDENDYLAQELQEKEKGHTQTLNINIILGIELEKAQFDMEAKELKWMENMSKCSLVGKGAKAGGGRVGAGSLKNNEYSSSKRKASFDSPTLSMRVLNSARYLYM
jgi:hypothetical protein